MKYKPQFLLADPYLAPYEDIIINRLHYTRLKEQSLLTGAKNLSEFADAYKYFGLHKNKSRKKWILREWAPNATAIYLIGNFTDWKIDETYALTKTGEEWELELPLDKLKHGDLYRLSVHWNGGQGDRIPAWAKWTVQDEETKIFNAQVWDPPKPYKWKYPKFKRKNESPLIYECHVGMAGEAEKTSTYSEFRKQVLPRVVKAGYNTIQLMAIQEHPYYGSFGYHVSSFFAPSSRFGDPYELKALIDEAHKYGIAVIMDIVHSHAVKNEIEGISKYDGSYSQFFYEGNKGYHEAWDSRCFDYGKREVLRFLLSNCKYWLDEFHFDGYRFDGVTSMLYWDHGLSRAFTNYDQYFDGGQDDNAISYLILANKLIHEVKPSAITIAEEMSGMPGLATPLEQGGYGFDYRLAMGIPDYWIKVIKERKDEEWDVNQIYYELTSRRNDEKVISYSESHDQALVGDKTIIFRLIDKEMYYHMNTDSQNLIVDRGIALHKMIRLVTLATSGGGYLNFMGNEFGHPEWIDFPREGNNWSFKYARRQWSLYDNGLLRYKHLGVFDRDMIKLLKSENVFEHQYPYLHIHNIGDQVLIFERKGLIFVFNFNPSQSFTDYAFDTKKGKYKIVLNADNEKYGGFSRIDENMIYETHQIEGEYFYPYQLRLYLPSRCAFVLKRLPQY